MVQRWTWPAVTAAAESRNGRDELGDPLPQGRESFRTLHSDRDFPSRTTRDLLEILGFDHQTAVKGCPTPIQAGNRWPIKRTHSWMNGCGKLRRFTDKRTTIIEFSCTSRPP